MKFVKLRSAGRKADVHLRADAIEAVVADDNDTGCRVETARGSYDVRESAEQILALLAEPGPSVEVAEEAVAAAEIAYGQACSLHHVPSLRGLRAAIEAADRARGLRP